MTEREIEDLLFLLDETETVLQRAANGRRHKVVSGCHASPMTECLRCDFEKQADRVAERAMKIRRDL